MQKYVYKAWDTEFRILKGEIEEDNIEAAKDKLFREGLNVIKLTMKTDYLGGFGKNTKLKNDELAFFCSQMVTIVSSGINILKGIEVLQGQTKSRRMKVIMENLYSGVKRGKTLSAAMKDTAVFPELLCDMTASGEISGNLDSIFENMEHYYNREAAIKAKIKTASIYPSILLFVAIGMIFFFNFFVFSELKDLFDDVQNLPGITKALISSMNYINTHVIQIIIALSGLILLIKYLISLKEVKYYFDKFILGIPMIGTLKKDIITTRFTRTMALFIKSAVPILQALENMVLIVGNEYVSKKLEAVKNDMINGQSISEALENNSFKEPLVIQMIRVGEESGKLEESLTKLSDVYDKRVEANVNKLMAMIEPMFTLIIGIFVALIIVAMAMPVMQMTNSLK